MARKSLPVSNDICCMTSYCNKGGAELRCDAGLESKDKMLKAMANLNFD